MEETIQELLKEINQLSLDIEQIENKTDKDILKAFVQLKIKYLSGLIKEL